MRASGILMHTTSLPGPYGIGTMGKAAYEWIDFLKKAGQRYWQILPLNPTGYGDSPYQSCSAYAGNHYLIDLDLLAEQGLLLPEEIAACNWGEDACRVDFGLQYAFRMKILRKAYARFRDDGALTEFCSANESWISEFALVLELCHTRKLAEHGEAVEHPSHFGVRRNVRLNVEGVFFGIKTASDVEIGRAHV